MELTCNEIIIYIIIPILSAIIGGSLTLIGVLLTIGNENKKRREEVKLATKPLFYIADPTQVYSSKNFVDIVLIEKNEKKYDEGYELIFKNTDKAIFIIEYIEINGIKHYPKYGDVVDKNLLFCLRLLVKKGVLNCMKNRIILSVNDLLNNNYKYQLEYTDEDGKMTRGYIKIIK